MDRRIRPERYLARTPNQVALAGDWHGNLPWATQTLETLAGSGVDLVLHLGDLGVWPGDSGARYLGAVEKACVENGIDVWLTPGNHEDWGVSGNSGTAVHINTATTTVANYLSA